MSEATAKQVGYVRSLLAERDWRSVEQIAGHVERGAKLLGEGHLDAAGASWMITQLQRCERLPMPDGRYLAGGRRFRCSTPTEGQWAGFTSVKEQDLTTGAWGSFLKADARREALRLINGIGWAEAGRAYAAQTGECPYCHQELRDPVSVASGAGRDCRKKHGIPTITPAKEHAT